MPERQPLVSPLQADPDLAADLSEQEAERARLEIMVPCLNVAVGGDAALSHQQEQPELIGFLVLEGLLLREIEVAGAVASELIGPGDLIHPRDLRGAALTPLRGHVRWRVLSDVSLAVLDGRFTRQSAPWPQVLGRVALRAVWRTHGLALNVAISRHARVEDRLLLLFWHLSQRFGRVRPDAVWIELPLTHEMLARLIGAQRPSVTSALGELSDRQLLVRGPRRSWLLPLPIPDELEPLLSRRAIRRNGRSADQADGPDCG